MAANYAKVDVDIDSHPKIMDAGFFASAVFQFILRINRKRQFDGVVKRSFVSSRYIATQLQWFSEPAISEPESLAEKSIKRCVDAQLLAENTDGDFVVVGYSEEWAGPMSSTERVRKYRESPERVTRCNGDVTATVSCNGETPQNRPVQTSTDHMCRVADSGESPVIPGPKKPKPKRTPKYTEAELAVVAVVLEKLSTWAHCTYRPGTESYRKLIVARMRGDNATETELRNVVWHKGNEWEHDEDMSRYLRPSTLFQASKWAEYRDAAMAWASDGGKNNDSENPGRNRRRNDTDDETLRGLWGDNGNPRA